MTLYAHMPNADSVCALVFTPDLLKVFITLTDNEHLDLPVEKLIFHSNEKSIEEDMIWRNLLIERGALKILTRMGIKKDALANSGILEYTAVDLTRNIEQYYWWAVLKKELGQTEEKYFRFAIDILEGIVDGKKQTNALHRIALCEFIEALHTDRRIQIDRKAFAKLLIRIYNKKLGVFSKSGLISFGPYTQKIWGEIQNSHTSTDSHTT